MGAARVRTGRHCGFRDSRDCKEQRYYGHPNTAGAPGLQVLQGLQILQGSRYHRH